MRSFLITYAGMWLGGKAVIFAETPEQALDLLTANTTKGEFHGRPLLHNPQVKELDSATPNVAYNDDGDY